MLLLVALVLRAGIPDGWMPNLAGAGEAPLVICTGAGPLSVRAPAGHPPDKQHPPGHTAVCAFAGVGSAPPAPMLDVAPMRFVALERLEPAAARDAPAKPWRRGPSARGPPRLV